MKCDKCEEVYMEGKGTVVVDIAGNGKAIFSGLWQCSDCKNIVIAEAE